MQIINALSPIETTLFDIITDYKDPQLQNDLLPIDMTPFGITTDNYDIKYSYALSSWFRND